MGGAGIALALLLAWPAAFPQSAEEPAPGRAAAQGRAEPYKRSGEAPLDYRGAGREDAEPDVGEVALGWFGPADPDHHDFGEPWRGARLALADENAAGGYRGKPFRLLPVWSESPWQAGITELTRLVYERRPWAVIGGVDGSTTHLAVQTALKARIPLLSPGSSDVGADHANVPWLFSLPASDAAQAPAIAAALTEAAGAGRFAIVAATDHDSHAALTAVRRALAHGPAPSRILELAVLDADLSGLARGLVRDRPDAILVLAPAALAGRLVAEIRRVGFQGPLLGGATLATNAFRRAAGAAAEGVRAPLPVERGPGWETFARSYENRWGEAPDLAAARGYDAVRLIAAAVRRAGLNRARIRDELRALAPWGGASGLVRWDAVGRNRNAVGIGGWRDGRLLPVPQGRGR